MKTALDFVVAFKTALGLLSEGGYDPSRFLKVENIIDLSILSNS